MSKVFEGKKCETIDLLSYAEKFFQFLKKIFATKDARRSRQTSCQKDFTTAISGNFFEKWKKKKYLWIQNAKVLRKIPCESISIVRIASIWRISLKDIKQSMVKWIQKVSCRKKSEISRCWKKVIKQWIIC